MFYYSEDGNKFISKIEALSYSKQKNKKIFFYYYDDVYENLNWKVEPPNTLDFYYHEQAQRIRDKYDHVILCYSGGYDSTNILETFYYNKLKLDKIVIVGAFDQDSNSGVDENHNGELYHNSFPYLKQLGLEDITQVCDYTKLFTDIKQFSIFEYQANWVDHMGSWFSPHNWFWRDIEKHVVPKEWSGKKVALIMGRDKPTLFYGQTNKPPVVLANNTVMLNGFFFRDTPITSYGNSLGWENCDRINFYWDPTYPQILLKQLHTLNHAYRNSFTNKYDKDLGVQVLSNENINDIIYRLKKPILFKSPKSKTNILSLRDNYLNNKKNSDVYDFYQKGISKIESVIDLEKMIPIQSKFYEIV